MTTQSSNTNVEYTIYNKINDMIRVDWVNFLDNQYKNNDKHKKFLKENPDVSMDLIMSTRKGREQFEHMRRKIYEKIFRKEIIKYKIANMFKKISCCKSTKTKIEQIHSIL